MREHLFPLAMELLRRQLVLGGVKSVLADLDGDQIHYFDLAGKNRGGPTVVLIHGLGSSAAGWSRVIFPFAKSAGRVLVPDMPGSGFGPLPRSGPLGFDGLLEFVDRFLEAKVGGPVVMIGNSLGGALVARFAARHPKKVRAAVLVAPAGAPLGPDKLKQTLTIYADGTEHGARELMRRVYVRPPPLLPTLFAPGMRNQLARPGVAKLIEEASRVEGLAPDEVRALSMPTLLLWGGQEKVLPFEGIDFFRQHLPSSAEINVIDGFGHCPQLERPRQLVGMIDSFLRRRLDPLPA